MNTDEIALLPGQRWLSDTEAELGLGLVTACDGRRVELLFPAAGETRLYAVHGAPLSRVSFVPGDRIRDRDGRELTVTEAVERDGVLFYTGVDEHGQIAKLAETRLDDHLRQNRPQERLLAGRIDRDAWFSLRHETWLRAAAVATSPVRGLLGARIGAIPHQLYIAHEVGERYAPRVLLADEVGLGKTIEAGLILHRLVLAGRAQRVLVVVPEPLLHQWLVEMLRRFNLRFALFDRERFAQAEGSNPFEGEQRVLCSLELLTSSPEVAEAVVAAGWELLVVDEAHHLHWDPQGAGPEYQLIAALAERTPGVLLLTATPEQLGRAGHFGRLRLLDPHRFHDYQAFLAEERRYQPVAELAARLLDGLPLEPEQRTLLAEIAPEAAAADENAPTAVAALVERLLDRHGTGRVLYRNTRAAVAGFPERRLHPYPLPLPVEYPAADPYPERGFGPGWERLDPRLPWLAETLRRLRPEKVLVICARAETVQELRTLLHRGHGIHAALFHEGLEIVERDRAAAYFADPEGSQVLLCSEIGSEGRNFQFAHHLVLFDLPPEPELLEQRIGRLDRIGQRETVEIHVPYLAGGAGERLFRWYAEGLAAFEEVCPAAPVVYEQLRERLAAALAEPEMADALIAETARLAAELNTELERGRDRLLELHSHRPEESARLVRGLEAADRDPRLRDYLLRLWDAFGVEHEPGSGHATVLHPGDHMLHHHFPGLPEEGLTVTFERADALAHEDREFLTWEHPMVSGAMELLTREGLGAVTMALIRERRLPPGTLLLEALYVADCPAPPELELGRFLPPAPLRLLLDPEGRERGMEFPPDALRGQCLTSNRPLAAAIVKSQGELLRRLLGLGERRAEELLEEIRGDALNEMERVLGAELERLRELATRNAGVRPEELEQLERRRTELAAHLARARPRLDAVRVVVSH